MKNYLLLLQLWILYNPFAKYLKIDTSGLFYKPINQYLLNDYNLPLYEKIETAKMSSATKIYQNVWIGNFGIIKVC